MANVFEYRGIKPVTHPSSFIHPHANIVGDVIIGKDVYIGPGASIRGDMGSIIIEDGCNVQENCIIHMFPGITVTLKKNVHVGHGAIIHGATIKENCLIGMNAVIMDNVVIGEESIIGALTLVTTGTIVPPRKVVAGNPGKIIKEVTDDMIEWKSKGTEIYQSLPKIYQNTFKPCEPIRTKSANRKSIATAYKTWKETKLNK